MRQASLRPHAAGSRGAEAARGCETGARGGGAASAAATAAATSGGGGRSGRTQIHVRSHHILSLNHSYSFYQNVFSFTLTTLNIISSLHSSHLHRWRLARVLYLPSHRHRGAPSCDGDLRSPARVSSHRLHWFSKVYRRINISDKVCKNSSHHSTKYNTCTIVPCHQGRQNQVATRHALPLLPYSLQSS